MSDFTDFYNQEEYLPHCKCGQENTIERYQRIDYRQFISFEDGCAFVDSEDSDAFDSWRYRCSYCGVEADDLEDILALRPEDEMEYEIAAAEWERI